MERSKLRSVCANVLNGFLHRINNSAIHTVDLGKWHPDPADLIATRWVPVVQLHFQTV